MRKKIKNFLTKGYAKLPEQLTITGRLEKARTRNARNRKLYKLGKIAKSQPRSTHLEADTA